MGLSNKSVGIHAVDSGILIHRRSPEERIIALAGNPNVGKSTIFNGLTGLSQHTGNWPGKTVASAQGFCRTQKHSYILVDIPGTYSLLAHSAEEEVARDFICFGDADAVAVICDATCLERNLNLVLQTLEITSHVILCVNLMDEAARKKIRLDLELLSRLLGIPVVGISARSRESLRKLTDALDIMTDQQERLQDDTPPAPHALPLITYDAPIEEAAALLLPVLDAKCSDKINPRWLALKLLDKDPSLLAGLNRYLGFPLLEDREVLTALARAEALLQAKAYQPSALRDHIVASINDAASRICSEAVSCGDPDYQERDRKIDRILTSPRTGYPIMLALLAAIFWITISGANYPSRLLSGLLFRIGDILRSGLEAIHVSSWLQSLLVDGIYRVLSWVVSVMLPPMAIFFPLFTLLEDVGYLPRIAYNLDYPFKKCCACGKQALSMSMGFGCNAAGVVGCRIIDSPRERLIAVLTNSFVPCNGRFPTLIAIITMFFLGSAGGWSGNLLSALFLTLLILLGILMTFLVSWLLSHTILKGLPSSFTLELPPYRRPQVGRIIVHSLWDRTIFVLGRAAAAAAPAGLLIWMMANLQIGGVTLLAHCAGFLDPFARLMGLDGTILMAFLLGLPANEIVVPILIMAYLSQGSILELNNLSVLKTLLVDNGWTWITAVSACLFSLMHWPCATTLMTIRKETGGVKWMLLALLLPTLAGIIICMLFNSLASLLL